MPQYFERLLWIFFAGGVGSMLRHIVTVGLTRAFPAVVPLGTLLANVMGCFLIAVVLESGVQRLQLSAEMRLTLSAGFLGGLTTYSSFNYETLRLLHEGAAAAAVLNFLLTTVCCLVAGWLGVLAAAKL